MAGQTSEKDDGDRRLGRPRLPVAVTIEERDEVDQGRHHERGGLKDQEDSSRSDHRGGRPFLIA